MMMQASQQEIRQIYGKSPALQEVLRAAELVSATDAPVLITGETGTGKALLARTIHAGGSRATQPFVRLDCAALSAETADEALIGHTANGGDSAAAAVKDGHLARAHDGALLLDEVAELPLEAQASLLRFLETGDYPHPAGKTARQFDVRVIAVTHQDLQRRVADGAFRADLFYRLNIVPLELPPLRKRLGDLTILLDAFFRDLVAEHKLPPPTLTRAALNKLGHYPWPGNIRELRNFCERLLILMTGKTVDVTNLPQHITDYQPQKHASGFVLPAAGIDINQLEYDLMQQALDNAHGNKSHAARLLGLSRDTFLYRMKKYMSRD